MSTETPLKHKGSRLASGWETWRTVPGGMVAGQKNAPLFSPDPTAADEAPTPRLHGGSLMPEALAPTSPVSLPADSSGGGSEAAAGPSAPRAALGPTNSLWAFFVRELQWGHSLSWRQRGMPTEHVMNFLRVTVALEPFLTFGHFLCIDLFLFHFTALPLRCAGALWRLGCMAAASLLRRVGLSSSAQGAPLSGSAAGFTQAQAYDLIKGAIFLAATLALGAVQVSRVYHYIRGEAIIKLCVALCPVPRRACRPPFFLSFLRLPTPSPPFFPLTAT